MLPAYNEEAFLPVAVEEIVAGLRERGHGFEVLVVENGSTDRTAIVAAELAARSPELRVEQLARPDYGAALKHGFLTATGEVVVNFDVDYFDLDFLDGALRLIGAGEEIVVAAKRGEGSADTRTWRRRLVTGVFGTVLRRAFGLRVIDTHGMKVMRRLPLVELVAACRMGTDLYDTELLIRAERAGRRVAALPVTVVERRDSRSSILRRIPRSVKGLGRLWLLLRRETRGGGVRG